MTESKKTSNVAPNAEISESERMAKIRELLVGPVIADESARVDQSVERLHEIVNEQRDLISTLEARLQGLEEKEQNDMARLRVRLFGMMEALLADEDDVRARIQQNQTLASKVNDESRGDGA